MIHGKLLLSWILSRFLLTFVHISWNTGPAPAGGGMFGGDQILYPYVSSSFTYIDSRILWEISLGCDLGWSFGVAVADGRVACGSGIYCFMRRIYHSCYTWLFALQLPRLQAHLSLTLHLTVRLPGTTPAPAAGGMFGGDHILYSYVSSSFTYIDSRILWEIIITCCISCYNWSCLKRSKSNIELS